MLTNPRHERFAQGLAQGKPAGEAYSRSCASRLRTNANVQQRVAELQSEAAAAANLTKQWVIKSLIEVANNSLERGSDTCNGAAANRALELLGKELGMFIERSENRNIIYDIHPEPPLTDEQWLEKHGGPKLLISC